MSQKMRVYLAEWGGAYNSYKNAGDLGITGPFSTTDEVTEFEEALYPGSMDYIAPYPDSSAKGTATITGIIKDGVTSPSARLEDELEMWWPDEEDLDEFANSVQGRVLDRWIPDWRMRWGIAVRQECTGHPPEPGLPTTASYRMVALWTQDPAGKVRWIPGASYSAHEAAYSSGLSYDEFAAMPVKTVAKVRKFTARKRSR